jgi:hypothetical protein
MRYIRLTTLLGIQLLFVSRAIAAGANPTIIWDLAEAGRFDPTHKRYSIENGRVIVDLRDGKLLCPLGLGHLASGRDSVRQIVFRYQVPHAGRYWLHVIWNPGGSGKEQFEVLFNGVPVGKSQLIDGSETPEHKTVERFLLKHESGQNQIELRRLSGDGMRFEAVLLTTDAILPAGPPLKPTLKFPTLTSYAQEIGEPGVVIDSGHVRFYAPKRKEKEAGIIHGYLVRAYEELYRIVGIHTRYRIVVYSLPEDHPDFSGGTSGCTLWYGYQNLEFESQPEWTQHHVPHVSGYIEEMAHNFVAASLAQFGWEMTGWSISRIAVEKVADNPTYRESLARARKIQAETFARYRKSDNTLPADIPANKCDRIHAHLLHLCEQQYGPQFWPDFFKEIGKSRDELLKVSSSGPGEERRNARYRITIDCFDRLMDGKFKEMLKDAGISLTTDVKSLQPNRPDWNRRLM